MATAAYRVQLYQHKFRMHREVNRVLEAQERGRPYRAAFYACLLMGGLILMIDPTRQLAEAGEVRWAWGGFMVAGSLFSVWGVIRNHWRMEWYGLPLQVSAVLGLIFVLVVGGGTTARLAFAFLVAALLPPILHRFFVLLRLWRATKKMVERGGD